MPSVFAEVGAIQSFLFAIKLEYLTIRILGYTYFYINFCSNIYLREYI